MPTTESYARVIGKTQGMVRDDQVRRLAKTHGLQVLDVTWEDTGRFDNSAVGPNISDMTIQVQHQVSGQKGYELSCMPVIRYPNFTDVSGDISPDEFFLLVGNEKGEDLTKITLRELLGDLKAYLHDPTCWKGERTSLLADSRDSHVLVSAQACFLPIPQEGMAQFNPVLFNYQSVAGDPAVLTILATREGTSITVIDNERDGFDAEQTWGQRLFFNQNGERASLMADIAAQINKVYQQADYVGSLVVDGPMGRSTEYEGTHIQPPDWWDVFWERHFENTGQSREEAIELLRRLLGDRWTAASLGQAEEALTEENKSHGGGSQ